MRAEQKNRCPVCGSGAAPAAPACACPVCGFAWAFAGHFAGKASRDAWAQAAQAERGPLLRRMQELCREGELFSLQGGVLAVRLARQGILCLLRGGRVEPQGPEVLQYSAPEHAGQNEVRLLAGGGVRCSGDNEYRQCDGESFRGIRRVLAQAKCTYAVTEDGQVLCSGQPVSPEVLRWRHIRDLVCGPYHAAGLTEDGRVLIAGPMLNREVARTVERWRDVTAVACAGDATLGLRRDGTAVFAGRPEDPRRAAESWRGVTAIAMESVYAVGLTGEGRILLAGENPNDYLDMGRKEAAGWQNIAAVSCSRSGIAALEMDGTLHLAGNIREGARLLETWAGLREEAHRELVQAARHAGN